MHLRVTVTVTMTFIIQGIDIFLCSAHQLLKHESTSDARPGGFSLKLRKECHVMHGE